MAAYQPKREANAMMAPEIQPNCYVPANKSKIYDHNERQKQHLQSSYKSYLQILSSSIPGLSFEVVMAASDQVNIV